MAQRYEKLATDWQWAFTGLLSNVRFRASGRPKAAAAPPSHHSRSPAHRSGPARRPPRPLQDQGIKLRLNIPDTVTLHQGQPVAWYFTRKARGTALHAARPPAAHPPAAA